MALVKGGSGPASRRSVAKMAMKLKTLARIPVVRISNPSLRMVRCVSAAVLGLRQGNLTQMAFP